MYAQQQLVMEVNLVPHSLWACLRFHQVCGHCMAGWSSLATRDAVMCESNSSESMLMQRNPFGWYNFVAVYNTVHLSGSS
jgi:hypothetical protein